MPVVENSSSMLRRSLQSTIDSSRSDAVTDMYSRLLNQNGSLYTKGSGGIIGLVILGLFIIFFVYYCAYEVCRFYWCPSSASEDGAVLVTDGFTFTLTAEQRRDVLEAIFSDTSKSVTKSMFFSKKSNVKAATGGGKDSGAFTPGTTMENNGTDSVDLEANITEVALYDDPLPPSSFGESTEAHRAPNGLESKLEIDSANATLQPNQTLSVGADGGISEIESFEAVTTQLTDTGEKQATQDVDFRALEEESKEDEEDATLPINVVSISSIKNERESDGEDDSDEDENLCAICLSGYLEGEVVISSKYCEHLFHKECILEWLEKKDECPCCRVDMVTSGDISKATAELVGKSRMIRAVESIRVRPPSTPSSP